MSTVTSLSSKHRVKAVADKVSLSKVLLLAVLLPINMDRFFQFPVITPVDSGQPRPAVPSTGTVSLY